MQDVAVHVREAEVAALETERQPLVIEAEQVKDRGVQIVNVRAVLHRVEAEFVRAADAHAAFEAAAGEPHGEGVDVVIAAGGFAHLAHRRAAEFAAPDDDGVIEQAALLEIFDERGLALVDLLADFLEVLLQILRGPPWWSQLVS
jgi:hypothetical protein